MKLNLLILASVLMLASVYASSASQNSINTLLKSYNVSNGIITQLSTVNISYSGHQYAALYLGSNLYFLVNTTGNRTFTFVLNKTGIYNIIRNYTLSKQSSSLSFASFFHR